MVTILITMMMQSQLPKKPVTTFTALPRDNLDMLLLDAIYLLSLFSLSFYSRAINRQALVLSGLFMS